MSKSIMGARTTLHKRTKELFLRTENNISTGRWVMSSFLLGNTALVERGPQRERHGRRLQKLSRFGETR